MSHKSLPCPKCERIWKWTLDKDPNDAFCPSGYGCASEKVDTTEEKLDEISKRLEKIERDVSWIVRYMLARDSRPSPPPYIPNPTVPNWPNKVYCPKCGMEWSGVMGYVCMDQSCPIQMKVTC